MSITNATRKILSLVLGVFLLGTFCFAPLSADIAHAQSYVEGLENMNEGDGLGVQIGVWVMTVGSYITTFGGSLLDNALNYFVIKLASTLESGGSTGIGSVIENSWKTVRDISNIVFIFGFIYIGIATILNPNSSRIKGLIAQLIIAAVLINFSLFFVKALIDVSNFFAYQTLTLFGGSETNIDLAYAFTDAMGLTTLYETGGNSIAAFSSGGSIAFFIAGTLFLVIAGFVFAAAAILLTVRFVAMILFMIFSPFLFIGAVFTSMKKWWTMLISYAIYAPVFLFLMYLSIRILQASSWSQSTNLAELLALGAPKTEGFAVILQFTVAVIFLLLSLKAAEALGVAGSKATIDFGNKLRGYGQKTVTGAFRAGTVGSLQLAGKGASAGLAVAGRKTFGKLGYKTAEGKFDSKLGKSFNKTVQSAATKDGVTGALGRGTLRAGRALSKASFDFRNIGNVGKNLGIGIGKKGASYAQSLKDFEKRNQEIASMIQPNAEIYRDQGVGAQLDLYNRTLKNRDQALSNLSNEKNATMRARILDQIEEMEQEIDYMENANNKKKTLPTSMSAWAGQTDKFETFAKTRKNSVNLTKEQYAINLERRGDSLPEPVRALYKVFFKDALAHKQVATSLRKGLKKSRDEKLLDAVKASKS